MRFHNHSILNVKDFSLSEYFGEGAEANNHIISGGTPENRNDILLYLLMSFSERTPVIVLHSGNRTLENNIFNRFGSRSRIVNGWSQNFDPFQQLSALEVGMILSSIDSSRYPISASGQNYLNGISHIIAASQVAPTFSMYLKSCHSAVHGKLGRLQGQGLITADEVRNVREMLSQGEAQKHEVSRLLNEMRVHIGGALLEDGNQPVGIVPAVRERQVLCIDVTSGDSLMAQLCLQELIHVINQGGQFHLMFDQVNTGANQKLLTILRNASYNVRTTLCYHDFFSGFQNRKEDYEEALSLCNQLIVFSHSSRLACKRWSEYFAEYERMQETVTYNTSVTRPFFKLFPVFTRTSGIQQTPVMKRNFEAEEIRLLPPGRAIVEDSEYQGLLVADLF